MDTTKHRLTMKQQLFALEYCVDFNGTQAAIRAGYKAERAADAAFKLLKNNRIMKIINSARQSRVDALEFCVNKIGAKERARALCSMADYFEIDADGTFRFKKLLEIKNTSLNNVDGFKMGSHGEILGIKLKEPTRSMQQMMKLADIQNTHDCQGL